MAPFRTSGAQEGMNLSYTYLNSITSDSARLEKKMLLSVHMILEWLNWLKLKLQLETQIKMLLSNINPKIHFFNYSDDVNPFFIVALGLLMQISNESRLKKKKIKSSGEITLCRDDVPITFHHNFFFFSRSAGSFLNITAKQISGKTVCKSVASGHDILFPWSKRHVSLYARLSFCAALYFFEEEDWETEELVQKPRSSTSEFYWGTLEKTIRLKSIPHCGWSLALSPTFSSQVPFTSEACNMLK